MKEQSCRWLYYERGDTHKTDCGHSPQLAYGSASDNGFVYCCFCARPLKVESAKVDKSAARPYRVRGF